MKKINKTAIIVMLFVIIMLTGIITGFAKDSFSPVIKSISDGNSNGTMAKDISKQINSLDATLNNSFKLTGDELTYTVVVENTGSKYGILKDINIASSNNSMKYTVEGIKANDKLNGNSKMTFTIKAKAVSTNLTKSTDTVKFTLTFVDEDGNIVNPSNPNTRDNIIKYIIILIVSVSGIFFIVKRNKKEVVELIAILLVVGITGVSAASKGTISITMNVDIDPITPWDGEVAQTCFDKGTGTEEDPYQIKNGQQLACFAKSVNDGHSYAGEYVIVTKDIALNAKVLENNELVSDTSSLNEWTPAGDYTTQHLFMGNFNGNNKTIGGIYILNDPNTGSFSGLFGATRSAKISNLRITDSYVEGNQMTALLSSYNELGIELDNIETNGVVNALSGAFSGGMLGYSTGPSSNKTIVKNSTNNAKIISSASMASGIIGYNAGPDIDIENTKNTGDISYNGNRSGAAAGIVARSSGNNLKIKNSYNTGNVDSTSHSGGVLGDIQAGTIELDNVYNTGNVNSLGGYTAGIIGNTGNTNLTITKTYNTGNIKSESYAAGIVGSTSGEITITNSYNTGTAEADMTSNYAGGIIGLSSGLVTIENCHNEGIVKGAYGIGGIIGSSFSGEVNIKDCYNSGDINGGIDKSSLNESSSLMYTGGIAGYIGAGTIEDSYNTGYINAIRYSGGVAGTHQGTITNSYNLGKVEGYYFIGGIVGVGNEITKSYNKGLIKSYDEYDLEVPSMEIGGISGKSTTINECYNVGKFEVNGMHIGGISGQSNVKNSYNISDIVFNIQTDGDSLDYSAAGITYNGNVDNCYNTGNIGIKTKTAGAVMANGITSAYSSGYVKNSCNTGNIELGYFPESRIVEASGIMYKGTSDSTGNYSSGKITLDSRYNLEEFDEDHQIKVGALFGEYDDQDDLNVELDNKYIKHDNIFTNYAVGTSRYDLAELIVTTANDMNFGTQTTEQAPSILSVINVDNAFKADTENKNNGYPVLK
ncbi:MAG: hypothetical protein E7160_01790 [Firmicutes bacterium]|nr:hypothetical protein [Bacillota bacterium]